MLVGIVHAGPLPALHVFHGLLPQQHLHTPHCSPAQPKIGGTVSGSCRTAGRHHRTAGLSRNLWGDHWSAPLQEGELMALLPPHLVVELGPRANELHVRLLLPAITLLPIS